MKKEITKIIPESNATHAEILWYKINENSCLCRLFYVAGETEDGVTEQTIEHKRIYKISDLPFVLSDQEISFLTGNAPDETWNEELTEAFLDKNGFDEIPKNYVNSYDPGDALTLSEKMATLDTEKKKRLAAGFMIDDILFDSDITAELRYTQLAIKFQSNPEYSTAWKAANNVWVTMDATLFNKILSALDEHIAGVYAWLAEEQGKIGLDS